MPSWWISNVASGVHLSLRGEEDACREFLASRMDWLDDLVREIEAAGEGKFYSSGARIARDIVNRARNDP